MNSDLTLFPHRGAVSQEVWDAHNRSCAHRLLVGAGQATVVAYREDPMLTLTAVAHGIAADGSLVIATTERELTEVLSVRGCGAMEVRISIEKEAPDPTVEIVSAALHLLGQAQWMEPAEIAQAIASGFLPDRIAELAAVRGGKLAIVRTDRVLLHDCGGVTPVPYSDVLQQHREAVLQAENGADLFATPEGEWSAADIIAAYGARSMRHIYDGVVMGVIPGALLARQSVRMGCEHIEDVVLCLDVDRTGLTLMSITHDEAVTLYVPFERAVVTEKDFLLQLSSFFRLGF